MLLEVLASIVLLLFVTFFLLKDGEKIWAWFLKAFGTVAPRVDRAGRTAWVTLSHYVQGTVAVAAVHGVLMGIVLAIMGVPLWAALAVLIFLASFIPIVGIFFAGAVATLVTLGAKGPIYALIFLGILLVEQQLENHVLQPLIVGRALHFHPLAIILVLAVGGILAGIAGAAWPCRSPRSCIGRCPSSSGTRPNSPEGRMPHHRHARTNPYGRAAAYPCPRLPPAGSPGPSRTLIRGQEDLQQFVGCVPHHVVLGREGMHPPRGIVEYLLIGGFERRLPLRQGRVHVLLAPEPVEPAAQADRLEEGGQRVRRGSRIEERQRRRRVAVRGDVAEIPVTQAVRAKVQQESPSRGTKAST